MAEATFLHCPVRQEVNLSADSYLKAMKKGG
jgi:hypothetical protein